MANPFKRISILLGPKNVRRMSDPTPADEAILRVLRGGRATQGYIVSETEFSRTHVHNRLLLMEARGWAENIHEQTALWAITDEAPPLSEDVKVDDQDGGGSEDDSTGET
jgi:hypothetical protein